jgi:hypothetical protein
MVKRTKLKEFIFLESGTKKFSDFAGNSLVIENIVTEYELELIPVISGGISVEI